jgi:hypothetical protein
MSDPAAYGGNFADSPGNVCRRGVENRWEKPVHAGAKYLRESDRDLKRDLDLRDEMCTT